MPPSHSCQTARNSLEATKALHLEFAAAYALAVQTRDRADISRVHELRTELDTRIAEFKEANKTITIPKLVPGIFANWPSFLETIKVTELDKEFTRISLEIGGRSEEELLAMLNEDGFKLTDYAEVMMDHDEFKRSLRTPNLKEPDYMKWKLKPPEETELICLSVAELGFSGNATMDQVYTRAIELGLELCPPEVGFQLRSQYVNQPMGEVVHVGMQQIVDPDGEPLTFSVERRSVGLWLGLYLARPGEERGHGSRFVFRLRKNT